VGDLLAEAYANVPVRIETFACRCGCGQTVAAGRKFASQRHYDQSKGLSKADTNQLLARLQQGEAVKQLAREFGIAHTTVYRLLHLREKP
jgi:hypothetical protein